MRGGWKGGPERGGGLTAVRMIADVGNRGGGCVCAELETGPTRQCSLGSQAANGDGHQEFIGHGIDDAAYDRLQLPSTSDPSIDHVRYTSIGEESQGPCMLIVQNQVANHRSGDESREGQDIGNVPDLLMCRQ